MEVGAGVWSAGMCQDRANHYHATLIFGGGVTAAGMLLLHKGRQQLP
jgi:hypothetical protein